MGLIYALTGTAVLRFRPICSTLSIWRICLAWGRAYLAAHIEGDGPRKRENPTSALARAK
jgi:hypothetical protein